MWKNTYPIHTMIKRVFAMLFICFFIFAGCEKETSLTDENTDIEKMQAEILKENAIIEENERALEKENTPSENVDVPIFTKSDIPDDVKEKMWGVTISETSLMKFEDLSYLTLSYVNYDGELCTGNMIVDKELADEIISIFKELFEIKFPINSITPAYVYGGDDELSMEADNTSAFNDRPITGGTGISYHQLGRAIDINPLVNPYIKGNIILPVTAMEYADRSIETQGIINKDSKCVEIFKKYGWTWGGDWTNLKDYQHFEKI